MTWAVVLLVTARVLCPFQTIANGGSRANQTKVFLYEERDEKRYFLKGEFAIIVLKRATFLHTFFPLCMNFWNTPNGCDPDPKEGVCTLESWHFLKINRVTWHFLKGKLAHSSNADNFLRN